MYQGPIPYEVEQALIGACQDNVAHRQLYLSGHSKLNPHINTMVLTKQGRDYHVSLLLGKK